MDTRLSKLQECIDEVDGFVITHLPNVCYLVGFTGSNGMLIVTRKDAVLFTDSRYTEQCAREVQGAETYIIEESYAKELAKHPLTKSMKKIGFEEASIKYTIYQALREEMRNKELVALKNKVEAFRRTKDTGEIAALRRAAEIADRAFESVIPLIRPGEKENDIAAEFEYRLRKNGAEKVSFETIVASGPNAALPHARASERELLEGDTVIFDFGAVRDLYSSDATRTLILGKNEKASAIYEIVLRAQETAINAVKPGVVLKEIDGIARNIIAEAGYGEYFGHGLGHGVGLEVHEAPRVSKKSEATVELGMVFTIEPGIYLPGFGGVRIEDTLLVTERGAEAITRAVKM
jgi:Xaa-Pro aminopeptidase